jgi:YcxB-like protein
VTGTLTFSPQESHLLAAFRLNYKVGGWKRIAAYMIFGVIVGIALATIDGSEEPAKFLMIVAVTLLYALFILVALMIGIRVFWIPRYTKRIFSQQQELRHDVAVHWNETHFVAEAQSGRTEMKWGDFYRWKRNDDILLLFRSEALFNFLPIDGPAFAAAADDMQRFMTEAGVKEKK